jgi:predicted nucleic acid-binding protein
MILTKTDIHLLDVNLLIALLDQYHVHHETVSEWFEIPDLHWALSAFSEAGTLRYFTRPKPAGLSMSQATAMLEQLKQQPGYHYQSVSADWQTLTKPFSKRIHGHNQVTDAYLLGLAVREGLILVTLDHGILHLAGEHREHVLVLGGMQS